MNKCLSIISYCTILRDNATVSYGREDRKNAYIHISFPGGYKYSWCMRKKLVFELKEDSFGRCKFGILPINACVDSCKHMKLLEIKRIVSLQFKDKYVAITI